MGYPNNLSYTKDHQWINFDEQYALIGITDVAQKKLGAIAYVYIPTLNLTIDKAEIFGTVEAVYIALALFMPVTGKVVAVNHHIEKKPELLSQDPYSSWVVKVLMKAPEEKESLLTAKEYKNLIGADTL